MSFPLNFLTFSETSLEIKQIKDLEHLKELASQLDEHENLMYLEAFILLNAGLRSSKNISYYKEDETWDIFNLIDDTEQEDLSIEDLKTETNILDALDVKVLYYWDYTNEN